MHLEVLTSVSEFNISNSSVEENTTILINESGIAVGKSLEIVDTDDDIFSE